MARLFILIKKGNKLLGAIPAKKGVTKARLMASIKGRFKKGFSGRVISEMQLKRILIRLRPSLLKSKRRRKSTVRRRRKIRSPRRRRKVVRRVKRPRRRIIKRRRRRR